MNPMRLWNALPALLRKSVAYGLMAGVAMALVVFAFAAVPLLRDWLRDKLEIPSKSELVGARVDDQALAEDAVRGAIEFAVRNRAEADSARYAAQFEEVSRTIIEPGIKRLRTLEEQVAHLNHLMGVNQGLLQEVTDASKDTRSRVSLLQHQLNTPPPTDEATQQKLDEVLRLVEELKKAPPRNTKVKL